MHSNLSNIKLSNYMLITKSTLDYNNRICEDNTYWPKLKK